MNEQILLGLAICAVLSAKWAMELEFNQFRQLLWGIAGFVAGPLGLLILYVRLLKRQMNAARTRREMLMSQAKDL